MDVVSVPLQLASGVEYPGLFLMKDKLYFLDKEQPYLLTTIIAHEVAHQWWYALVGNDVIEHPWQDEALTTFSSLLYLEQFQPRVYDGTVEYFRKVADEIESIRSNTGIGQPVSSFKSQPAQYSSVVYSKGAMFFVELRNKIGDQAFFQALQAYFSQNQYQLASPGSLLSEFEKACQCDLSDFYLQWGLKNK
jgi:aminopeptidase N